jgi:hypothetical protein
MPLVVAYRCSDNEPHLLRFLQLAAHLVVQCAGQLQAPLAAIECALAASTGNNLQRQQHFNTQGIPFSSSNSGKKKSAGAAKS